MEIGIKFLKLTLLLLLLSACTSTENPEDSLDTAETQAEEDSRAKVEEEVVEAELDQAGFCKDDIYAKFLTSRYKKENKAKKYRSSRSRRRYKKQRESNALHFAAEKLKGPIPSYFGGIPVVMNKRVEFWIRYFKTKGRHSFLRWIVRGESLKKIIQPILSSEGVPEELYYLAMVESGFNNKAYSRASATGAWQFMRGTANSYGLRTGYWVDERRDPAKATRAAAKYLKDLYTRFGDWYLAIAAYNAGPGKVNKSIRRAKSRDFWKIAETRHLSKETRNYVPKMLAAITLAANIKEHGFDYNADPIDELPLSKAIIKRPVRLSEVSKHLNLPISVLKKWNPELIREITPPKRVWKNQAGYHLRIPGEFVPVFNNIEPKLSYLQIKDIQLHRIRSGDTLSAIARRYKVSIKNIRKFNPKLSPKRLRIGKKLAIPIPAIVTTKKKKLT